MKEVTIGGERLGSGKKNKAYLHNYERSTHDLSYIWRSTMSAGTLVPFMTELALPGDTFDIDLECDILTHPTTGPLFGSYKVQIDVFQIPIRLYQASLHMNLLGIGLDMSKILLPLIKLKGNNIDPLEIPDNQQINPSCIMSYLGIRGIGTGTEEEPPQRNFNAIPFLSYWDIYKNYYANKQEEIGAVIHRVLHPEPITLVSATVNYSNQPPTAISADPVPPYTYETEPTLFITNFRVDGTGITDHSYVQGLLVAIQREDSTEQISQLTTLFENYYINEEEGTITFTELTIEDSPLGWGGIWYDDSNYILDENAEPQIFTFPLENIDTARKNILQHTEATPYEIDPTHITPYSLILKNSEDESTIKYNLTQNQEGLAIKTYQSDLFNNWINTEWIDGENGINAVTAIQVGDDGSFTIDELNLSKKIYEMLNRIAISGGTYDDWLDAVYTHERRKSIENPMYIGGLIKELVFQEVISNSATEEDPLGTLAGRGKLNGKHKGGKIIAKIDEPSYIMGIISLTPRIDYSQGNKWDTNLLTLNDFHKPALDEIGFQPLITDQMAWWETISHGDNPPQFRSAGKQPAWINYMTNVNITRGNFAVQDEQMFMTLNRNYEAVTGLYTPASIKDLTTYIDPSKFNHIFADARRDAQNFWAQIGVNIEARRKMSAKIMPNL